MWNKEKTASSAERAPANNGGCLFHAANIFIADQDTEKVLPIIPAHAILGFVIIGLYTLNEHVGWRRLYPGFRAFALQ